MAHCSNAPLGCKACCHPGPSPWEGDVPSTQGRQVIPSQHQKGSLDFQRRLRCQHDLQQAPPHKAPFLRRKMGGSRLPGARAPREAGDKCQSLGGRNPRPRRADKQEDLGRIPQEKPLTAHPEGTVQGCTAPSSSRGWLGRGCRTLPGPPPFPSTFALAQPPLASDGKRPPLKAPTAPKPRAADSCCITARETVAAFPY